MAYFDLKVGFLCNNNCVHCVITDKKDTKDLTTEEIKEIISSRPPEDEIGFTGGEPTIRKDFVELVKFAKETGHSTNLQTNGTGFFDENMVKEVSKYLDHVLIAIHSCDKEIHDKIVQKNGMWEKTIEGFKNIIKYGIPHTTQTVISSLNIVSILETYDMIQEMSPGCKMNFTYPHPNGNAYKNHDIVVPRYTDIKQYIQPILKKYRHLLCIEAIPLCYLFPYQDEVYHNFDEDMATGNLNRSGIDPANTEAAFFNEKGITEDYFSSMLSEKRKGYKCTECVFDKRCVGVWKEYVEFHKKHFDLFPITAKQLSLTSIKKEESVEYNEEPCEPKDEKKVSFGKTGALILYGNEKCMNTCLFCSGSAGPQDENNKWNKAIEDINYFIKDGVDTIEISGGDPGEYKRIVDIVKYMKLNGIKNIQLSTHGRTLKNDKLVKELKEAGLNSVKVPLYGSNEEIHNRCTQVNNSFGNAFLDTTEGLKNCAKNNIDIKGYIVPNQFNKNDLINIINLYIELGGTRLEEIYFGISFIAEKNYNYTGNWFLPLKDFGPYIRPVLDNIPNLPEGLKFNILDVPYCAIGGYSPYIENKFAGFPNLGNHDVEEQNRSNVSSKVPHYRIKSYFEECNKCIYNDICGAIPKNELDMFGSFGLKGFKEEQYV